MKTPKLAASKAYIGTKDFSLDMFSNEFICFLAQLFTAVDKL